VRNLCVYVIICVLKSAYKAWYSSTSNMDDCRTNKSAHTALVPSSYRWSTEGSSVVVGILRLLRRTAAL
jgi:hypothetical protein